MQLLTRILYVLDKVERSLTVRLLWYTFILGLILLLSNGIARGQSGTAGLSFISNASAVGQNEQVELTIRLDSAVSAYYFETEVNFDPDRLAFLETETDTLLGGTGGISVGDLLNSTTVGISGSRTSGEAMGPGNLMRVRFRVKTLSDTGTTTLSLHNPILKDSSGNTIAIQSSDDASFRIEPRITNGGLTAGNQVIHEAQSIQIKTFAYAHGVTNVSTPADSIKVWVGLNASGADPTSWSEDHWVRASHLRTDESGTNFYGATFGPALEVGNWYFAARLQLNDRSYKYGGFAADTGKFWDAGTAPAGTLTVEERPPYQHVLAKWDFDDSDRTVDQSLTDNRNSSIEVVGSTVDGYDTRDNGYTMATNSWHVEQGADSLKYLKTSFSTSAFQNIRVSSLFKGTGSSARDFQLQISLDDSVWSDVNNGSIVVGEDWMTGSLENLELPSVVNDQPVVYLRWLRVGDTRVDGTSDISSQGKVRVDDILITGTAINPEKPTVWPGDADNNGSVDISDVLPLGTWWNRQGPDRILRNVSWTGLEAIGWFPFESTFADTDGSGLVDQSDLEAIGLNFGNSWQQTASQPESTSVPQTTIPKLKQGDHHYLILESSRTNSLSGLSVNLTWQSDNGTVTDALTLKPVYDETDWLYSWLQERRLLKYIRKNGSRWSGAWVHKGWTLPEHSDRLMRFKVTARKDWPGPVTFRTPAVRIVNPDQSPQNADSVNLSHAVSVDIREDEGAENILPESTQLHPNHPNPFNPTTTLRYELATPGRVSLRIYSLLGKEVATLVDRQYQQAGSHSYSWNAANHSSGLYLYILKTDNRTFSGKMLLMK